jgi:glycine cleavage system H protein
MNIPDSVKYTQDHEWIRTESDNMAVVGITDYAQGELGDIVFVEIETQGEHLKQGEVFGTIEAVKTVSDLFMPVSGEVIAFNNEINDSPELVNSDPFGKGWLIRVKMDDIQELSTLLDASQYKNLIKS